MDASLPVIGDRDDGGKLLWIGRRCRAFVRPPKGAGRSSNNRLCIIRRMNSWAIFTTNLYRSGYPYRSLSVTVPNLGGFAGASVFVFQREGEFWISRRLFLWCDGWGHRFGAKGNIGIFMVHSPTSVSDFRNGPLGAKAHPTISPPVSGCRKLGMEQAQECIK